MSQSVHFSSKTNEWATPQELFDKLDAEFHFTLDPCATAENAKCQRYFTKEVDGLWESWSKEIVFCNPPYGRQIKQQPCIICANEATEGHHDDYSRPLEVVWLCNLHHLELHKQQRWPHLAGVQNG